MAEVNAAQAELFGSFVLRESQRLDLIEKHAGTVPFKPTPTGRW